MKEKIDVYFVLRTSGIILLPLFLKTIQTRSNRYFLFGTLYIEARLNPDAAVVCAFIIPLYKWVVSNRRGVKEIGGEIQSFRFYGQR